MNYTSYPTTDLEQRKAQGVLLSFSELVNLRSGLRLLLNELPQDDDNHHRSAVIMLQDKLFEALEQAA